MKGIKDQVEQMIQLSKVNKKREEHGLKCKSQSLHMVFTGNPGTGKTTAARLIGEAFIAMGLLRCDMNQIPFIEMTHDDIESPHPGVAEKKVAEKFKEAQGGVLFMDEAYAFLGHSHHQSNEKVMAVIIQKMEDFRDEVLVIAAGYPDEMEDFLNYNPGLRSRFSNIIHFPDYETADMVEIAQFICKEQDYAMTEGYERKLAERLEKERKLHGFGNARTIRNIIEQSIRKHSVRVSKMDIVNKNILITLTGEDLDITIRKPKDPKPENPMQMMKEFLEMASSQQKEIH